MIKIICLGKQHDPLYERAIAHFAERILHTTKLVWVIKQGSQLQGEHARIDDSSRILASIAQTDYVVLLDEKGAHATSEDLAVCIEQAQNTSRDICIVIGGSYGVDQRIHNRANTVTAYGKVVFPHQLMRLLVVEQLYRALSINAGSKYHHS